jgi:hypothetical protein
MEDNLKKMEKNEDDLKKNGNKMTQLEKRPQKKMRTT